VAICDGLREAARDLVGVTRAGTLSVEVGDDDAVSVSISALA
jgi:hypothetical protein